MRRKSDYAYPLPPALIAQVPADARDGSRLLRVGVAGVEDRRFAELAEIVPEGAVLVVNDTRVIPARLHTHKDTGGAVELLLLEAAAGGRWRAMARSSKPLRPGARLAVDGAEAVITVAGERDADGLIEVDVPGDALALLDAAGELPLPPYIERPDGDTPHDRERYQTVFAREPGAVAAPTAGLHFTPAVLDSLRARGCELAPITLHVGLGTFAPMRVEDPADHHMHTERYTIPEATAALVGSGRPVVAVGTTSVRALEASAAAHGRVTAGTGATDLFIHDDYGFRAVDHLITNFHLPESTLLMLVSAFAGYDRVMAAYRHAVGERYRFFSYGDAMWLDREAA